jgi:(2Fe-2S) ferredoxin
VNNQSRFTVIVCRGPTCGERRSSAALYARLEETIAARGLQERVTLSWETCLGHCLRGPNILVCASEGGSGGVLYNRMTVADLDRMVERHLLGGMVVRLLLNRPPVPDSE